MALKIRLARVGTKKRPKYRVVVADVRAPRDGRFIEIVGTYDPLLPKDSEDRVKLKLDRIRHWLGNGARPTDRVHRFLDAAEILKREPRNNPQKAIPRGQAKEDASAEEKPVAAPATDAPKQDTPAKEEPENVASEEKKVAENKPADEKAAADKPSEEASAEKEAEGSNSKAKD